MAHRESPSGGAVKIGDGRTDDAGMFVLAGDAAARARAVADAGLFEVPTRRG